MQAPGRARSGTPCPAVWEFAIITGSRVSGPDPEWSRTATDSEQIEVHTLKCLHGFKLFALPLILAACAGTPGGGGPVRLVTAEQLQGCRNMGAAHVSVIDRLEELQRTEGATESALLGLAKDSAAQLGGNSVVEMTNIVDGSQSFAVFLCP